MSELVKIQGLVKNFGNFRAVDGISFSVNKGEVLGLLGPNGAGKTTTMRMISGYLSADSGSAHIDGIDVANDPVDAKFAIGYLPEGGPLYNDMRVDDFLLFIAKIRKLEDSKINERFDFVVQELSLDTVLYKTIDTLSKGYKRRVALAAAIIHDPKVLILDEPTDGLDPNQKYDVQKLITAMAKDKAVIISTHILEEVEDVCSRSLVVAGGKVVASGTVQDIIKKSKLKGKSPSFREAFRKLTTKG